jgi:hypothetical protein
LEGSLIPYTFAPRKPFHGARLDAFCGGIRMDLREAVITEDEEIDIHTFMGGIELLVPVDVNVIVKSRSFIRQPTQSIVVLAQARSRRHVCKTN